MAQQTLVTIAICAGAGLVFLCHLRLQKRAHRRNQLYRCARCQIDLRLQESTPETLVRAQTLQEQHWYCPPCAARLRQQEWWVFGTAAALAATVLAVIFYVS